MSKISVIIPVYNVEKYIDECLISVCAQTFEDTEILLINDGSTDGSLAHCNDWEEKDRRIKTIDQINQGVSVARNRGIEEAQGEWIAFIDSDDWIDPDYLQVLYDTAASNSADIALCGFCYDYPGKTVQSSHFSNDMVFCGKDIQQLQIQILAKKMSLYKGNSGDRIGGPWCKLFRSEFLRQNSLRFVPGLKRSQDVVFNLYAFEKAATIAYRNLPLYHYRINEKSVCRTISDRILSDVKDYLAEMHKFIETYHADDITYQEAFDVKVTTSVYKCMVQYFFDSRYPYSHKQMKDELKEYLIQDIFQNSIKKVRYKNLEMTEKMFAFCLKHRMYRSLKLLVEIRKKLIWLVNR